MNSKNEISMDRGSFNNHEAILKRFSAVSIYAVAMGYLESAVVIYLRESVYGNSGQVFPFRLMEPYLGQVEFVREAATIVMLLAIGYLAGKNIFQKWMFFVYSFAVWDIFYYMFLRIFTGWPNSLGDFDVLFLIPVVWVSPVIAPILILLLLTLESTTLIFLSTKSERLKISISSVGLFLLGAGAVFYSFTEPVICILISQGPNGLKGFTPISFDWVTFLIGFLLMCLSSIKIVRECYHIIKSEDVIQ